jgi:hypothetical protein
VLAGNAAPIHHVTNAPEINVFRINMACILSKATALGVETEAATKNIAYSSNTLFAVNTYAIALYRPLYMALI